MWVTKQFLVPNLIANVVFFFSTMEVTEDQQFQSILFCVQQKKELYSGLEQPG